ncbi:MAG: hypothetical protein PHH12_03480 [Candidatus Shapirobacteria bacterium]|nr:hypothetical protein [Candidatus Shapirobacteria bacterium]
MKKVKREKNSDVQLGLGGGKGFTAIWKYNEDRGSVQAVKAKVPNIESVPNGYLFEKRCLSIRTKSGSWVLIPYGNEIAYGLVCNDNNTMDDIVKVFEGKLKKGCSYHVEGRYLYIEDRLSLSSEYSDWSVLLNSSLSYYPILFYGRKDGKHEVLDAWWSDEVSLPNGFDYKKAIADLNSSTKISQLARQLIEKLS